MALAKKRSRKAKGSSGISCGGLKDMQAEGCPLDIEARNELQLFLCRWNREHNMCSLKI
jgi:hypothetical protein